jgi:hypothetical protein
MRRRGLGRAGRPSLVGTMARTAVIAGTATAVSGRIAAAQQARAAQPPPPPPAPPPRLTDEVIDELKKLAELRDAGILTEDEFAGRKSLLLGG